MTTTPTRSLSSQPQPSRSAAVTPPPATVPAPVTTTARPPQATPTAAASSAAVVAPSAVTTTTPAATTAPVSTSSDSGSTWGWWVLAIVLLVGVIGGIIWASMVRKRRKWAEWRAAAAPVARQAHIVADLLPVPPQRDPDDAHWQQVREQAEHNAQALDSVAASAPSDDATRATQGLAKALRDEVSAVEAIRLLEAAPSAPTGPQLSQAEDATRRARIDLDASQVRLDALVGSQTGTDAVPT